MRARGDAHGPGRPDVGVGALEIPVVIEDLHPSVRSISDVHVPLRVYCNRVRRIELTRIASTRAPGFDELSVLVELGDARIPVAVRNENISGRIPGDIGRTVEIVAHCSRARQSAASPAGAFTASASAAATTAFT